MKINYKETENLRGVGHGVKFYYSFEKEDLEDRPNQEPIAFLEGYAWLKNQPDFITMLIRPVTSPKLRNRGQPPEIIISEVKTAIGLLLHNKTIPRGGILTEHVKVWFNA